MTDPELLLRFAADRDEEAFRRLYAAHTPTLYLFALRVLNNEGAAEEAVQEAWIRAAKRARSFENRSTVRTWLLGILINCCREQRRRDVEQVEFSSETAAPPKDVIDLERAIRSLGEGQREVLLLHDVYGYTHAEIAQLLGVEPGTSKSQLARAREHVRERIAGRGGTA